MNLVSLFLVSMAAVGYETALIRYFAVSKWSEYGYWVISIVMVGFALSGVVVALGRAWFERHAQRWLAVLPALLVLTAAGGFHLTAANPFNPLQLQNAATWESQLWNIAGYYAALLPFFFLTGIFISLCFVLGGRRIGLVYGFDLTGAAFGAAGILGAMFVVQPFGLVPWLLVPLALSAAFLSIPRRTPALLGAAVALFAALSVLILDNRAEVNDFKAIYAPLHTPDAAVVAHVLSPRGEYQLLDNFTERVDTDVSNNAAMLGIEGPPRSYGLYRDGNRIAALPMPGEQAAAYAAATLAAAPYKLIPRARTLLIGASGGFRPAEARALGASQVRVLEPEPVIAEAITQGMGPSPAWPADPMVRLLPMSPVQASARGVYDIVDMAADFLDVAESNVSAVTAEAIAGYLRVLAPNGIVSLPASIRDFPVYALRMLSTVREGLLLAGVSDPASHVVIYRSAWGVRILVSMTPWPAERIAAIKAFADERSFDVSYYPGIDIVAARAGIFNDLPAVSFEDGTVQSTTTNDAIADEAEAVLRGADTPSRRAFNLSPVTLDRPFFYSVLRLDQLGTILKRLELLPQPEVGLLVNLAVLGQATVIAILVLLVPLAAPGRLRTQGVGLARAAVYFPMLGLGFLFIEICLIERASFWLNDRTTGFAVVLTGMLLFSGIGSMLADRFRTNAAQALAVSAVVIIAWLLAATFGLERLILATLDFPVAGKIAMLLAILLPASLALGMPFPLGLARTGESGLMPWAWGLNGAFSVVATPLANLIAREYGFSRVLLCAAIMYVIALITFPSSRMSAAWHTQPSRSPDAT